MGLRIAVFAIALGLAAPAPAALIVVDLVAPGDGLVTRDTASGLDWLDVTETRGVTFDAVEAGAGGWIAAGWRHATGAEVCALFTTLGGVPSPCPGAQIYQPGNFGQPHLDFLGITDIRDQDYSPGTLHLEQIWAVYDDETAGPVGLVELSVDTHSDGWVQTFIDVQDDAWDPSRFTGYANFLVRAIPEPGSASLLAAGLMLVVWGRAACRRSDAPQAARRTATQCTWYSKGTDWGESVRKKSQTDTPM